MQSEIEINFDKLNVKIIAYFQNNDESLLGAKELFAPFIESTRRLEAVTNIQQLLKLLQHRGLYSKIEYNTFRIFEKIIDDESYSNLVAKQKELCKKYPDPVPVKKYGDPKGLTDRRMVPVPTNQIPSPNILNTRKPAPIPENKIPIPKDEDMRNDIFNIIANGVSLDVFRRLARHLDFTKEEIKDIELRHNDFRTQNLVLLRMYETRRNSLTRLLKVLNLIEKPDLVREITEVLRKYSLDNNFNNLSI
ncbi:unnamed protein product [Chironomus riparius]|uniref:Death domain-containing protein n=1 Tax=Chironomus riparius TaxID=315576 RepID=A0A9P0NIU6_9DIPT|nr:unnamed protein product [Chironomus riparius]